MHFFVGLLISPVRFPYLKAPDMDEGQKKRLLCRLEYESEKIQAEFSGLVDKVKTSLENQIMCSDLVVLIDYSPWKRLVDIFRQASSISVLFLNLRQYCSFFDYELISFIIRHRCPELISYLDEYVSKFDKYCQKRLCEVPVDVFKMKDHINNLYVKYDGTVNIKLERIKKLECQLSELLGIDLYLLKVEDGCIKLVFGRTHDLVDIFPLNSQQREKLSKLGILRLYSEIEYYDSSKVLSGAAVNPMKPMSIPDYDVAAIAEEVQKCKKVDELAGALEMSDLLRDINGDAKVLLEQWQKQMGTAATRSVLVYHLARIGMQELHTKLDLILSCSLIL